MRSLVPCSLICWLLIGLAPIQSWGQTTGLTHKHHPWGRFRPGAWKLVRVVNETFEEQGTLTSIAQTKITLREVADDGVTLTSEVSIELGGRQFDPQPQTVKQGFYGEPVLEDMRVTDLGTGEVTIQERQIPCKVEQLELDDPVAKTVSKTKIYYSDTVAPYVLRRESKRTDPEGKVISETTVEVIELDVPCNVLGVIRRAAHYKTVHTHPKGTATTLAVVSMDVPGGVVCQDRKELDNSDRMIARISLQLIDYGLEPDQNDRGGFFRRRRAGRRRASRSYFPQ